MHAKASSSRATVKGTDKSVRAAETKAGAKTVRLSNLERTRLESFRALMKKYGGKCSFANYVD
jgi:hypothetical protein